MFQAIIKEKITNNVPVRPKPKLGTRKRKKKRITNEKLFALHRN